MKRTLLFFTLLLMLSVGAFAQVITAAPATMNFQGRLARQNGTPIADGTHTLTFRIYDAQISGNLRWTEQVGSVVTRNGVFSALLGKVFPLNDIVLNGNPYLEIQVDNDQPLLPRQQFQSVAFALKANTVPDGAITTTKLSPTALDFWSIVANGSNPTFSAQNSGTGSGLYGEGHQYGVYGRYMDTGSFGGLGTPTYGVVGEHRPSHNNGSFATANYGAQGEYFANGNIGYLGTSTTGVYGSSTSGYGVYGNHASGNYGWLGGADWGVYGATSNTADGGVFGVYSPTNDYGWLGGKGIGVYGHSTNGFAGDFDGLLRTTAFRMPTAPHTGDVLTSDAIGTASWQAPPVNTGPQGPKGDTGPQGPQGIQGPKGDTGSGFSLPYNGSAASGVPSITGNPAFAISNTGGGDGIRAYANAGNRNAIYGENLNGGQNSYGVHGYASQSGAGVMGDNSDPNGWGGYFNPNIHVTHNISAGNDIFAQGFFTTSDLRYKMHVATLPNALDSIQALRGVTYDWNRTGWKEKNFPEGTQIGFIAQEVEKIFPGLVHTDKDGYKSVSYQNVAPILVEAVKSLNAKVDDKQKQIDELRADNAALKEQVKQVVELKKQLADLVRAFKQMQAIPESASILSK